jgi:hypothetical protein
MKNIFIKTLLVIVLFSLLICTGCTNLILTMTGFRMPKVESKKSIEKFLTRKKVDIDNTYAFDSTEYERINKLPFKPGWKAGFRPIQIRIYNHVGEPIMHWASCEGYLKDLGTFDTLPPRNQVNLDSTYKLLQDLNRYYTLDGSPAQINIDPEYDYYVIIYFAIYSPKMSKEIFSTVDHYIKQHSEYRFKVYKITVDYMDWWNVEINPKISITYKNKTIIK